MTRKLILASHGKFASGILSSLQLICGADQDITALDCYTDEAFDLTKEVQQILQVNAGAELIVVTDVFGGSVNNEFLHYIHQPNFYLVAGLNLPFLISLTTRMIGSNSTETIIQEALEEAKESIQFCNETIKQELAEEEF
ncbi:PTS sugar transporter subunit IIA [Enterococcus sp. AZ109]|uniref:PTS sugar transporter subunit IIA n=1 Tax=Enterococcus sp. AZ109 TaxID=2774634 RepID=UPI003F255B1C